MDQLSTDEVEQCELGRVAEPALGDIPVTLLDQLPGATVAVTAAADERRTRLLKLVANGERRGSRRTGKDIISQHKWRKTLADREVVAVERIGEPPPRFAEGTAPLHACAKQVRAALQDGDRVVLVGGERDLRFLGRRLANAAKHDMHDARSWADVYSAASGTLLSLEARADRGSRRASVLAIAAADLIGSRAEIGGTAAFVAAPAFDTDMELRAGDVVIHEDHGLAVVAGLEQMQANGAEGGDAIALRYADDALRLVPVAEADRVWRYGAEEDAVRLDKLDGSSWNKRRREIDEAIADTARQLTALAAERAGRTAPVLDPPPAEYERFAAGFPFSETPVPRIADMAPLAELLKRLVPELELLSAHGKMPAAEIDEAMVRFGRGDAQLHQLRGRVGRGSRRGQVLLLTGAEDAIAPRTLKRLRTLEAFDRLGAGSAISARDLDLRGAGDLMGDTQAGHMRLIGVELYQQLLEGALRTARGETVERWSPELNLGVHGRLPDGWIPDEDMRLTLYARLARIRSEANLDGFEAELEDRFGSLPEDAAQLLAISRLRLHACEAYIARVDAGPGAIAFTARGDVAILAEQLGLEEKNNRVLLTERIEDPGKRLARLTELIVATR